MPASAGMTEKESKGVVMALAPRASTVPNDLESYWMPFTSNRAFKKAPRLIARAKDMHYVTSDGRKVLDATAGLWCCNAGHNRDPIVAAIQRQAAELDYAPAFQFGHPQAFELANRISALAPGDLDHVFFCNSGSEAVDTALKIALAWHAVRGEGARTRLIGRERGYHGVGFGGISVGGIVNNRKMFGTLLAGVDHLPATYNREHQAFTKGEPEWGAHLADDLERIVALHDASTIAAVIVEPMAGSTGVLPAPQGYLQRLRQICDKYGILLIFDEVITGFGRLGFPFAAERYGVVPDIMTFAKGITSGTVPMGGGGGGPAKADLRGLHARARARGRALSRLYLFGPSARLRGRSGDARSLSPREAVRTRLHDRIDLRGGRDEPQRPAQRARYPHRRPHGRHRSRVATGRRRQARLCGDGEGFLRRGHGDPSDGRDHRDHAAADRGRERDRRDFRQGRER